MFSITLSRYNLTIDHDIPVCRWLDCTGDARRGGGSKFRLERPRMIDLPSQEILFLRDIAIGRGEFWSFDPRSFSRSWSLSGVEEVARRSFVGGCCSVVAAALLTHGRRKRAVKTTHSMRGRRAKGQPGRGNHDMRCREMSSSGANPRSMEPNDGDFKERSLSCYIMNTFLVRT